MPQEIVVPVITVKESESEKAKTRQVEFSLLGSHRTRWSPTRSASSSSRPRLCRSACCRVTVLLAMRDGDRLISNEQIADLRQHLADARRAQEVGDADVLAGQLRPHADYFWSHATRRRKVEALRRASAHRSGLQNDF
jgi:hypothetical protein